MDIDLELENIQSTIADKPLTLKEQRIVAYSKALFKIYTEPLDDDEENKLHLSVLSRTDLHRYCNRYLENPKQNKVSTKSFANYFGSSKSSAAGATHVREEVKALWLTVVEEGQLDRKLELAKAALTYSSTINAGTATNILKTILSREEKAEEYKNNKLATGGGIVINIQSANPELKNIKTIDISHVDVPAIKLNAGNNES